MRRSDELDEGAHDLGIMTELSRLPPGTIITLHGMAWIFGKSPASIMRAVREKRLPKPFRIFSGNCWRAGEVDVFLQHRMQEAQTGRGECSQESETDKAPGHLTPLKRGASPLRTELDPHARDT